MEAKVDVRKLQVLNDRINQTIDALNQVRLSVHGLGHTPGIPQNPFPTQGFGVPQPFGVQQPFGLQQPYNLQQPYGMTGIQGIPGINPALGFQHNPYQPFLSPFTNPLLTQGVTNPWTPMGTPWGFTQGVGGFGGGLGNLYGAGIGGGLFHTGPDIMERQLMEVRANDPFRLTQTFPFVIS
jgi:hypothetical protein